MKNNPPKINCLLPTVQTSVWLALLFLSTGGSPAAGTQTLYGHVPEAIARFHLQPTGRLPATEQLRLTVGLPLRNKDALVGLIQQLYDPRSTNFHRFLDPARFLERFDPTEADYQKVINFAKTNRLEVTRTSGDRVLVDVSATVSDIEKALHVNLLTYQHPTEPRQFFAPDVEPSVDANVPILAIGGLNNYYTPHPMAIRRASLKTEGALDGSGTNGFYQGSDFRNAYAAGVTLNGSGQMVGLVELEGYYTSDITTYESQAGLPNVPIQNVPLDNFSGPQSSNTNGVGECSLDIEMVICMAPGLSKLFVFEDRSSSGTDHILQSMVSSNQVKQFSCSWGLSQDGTAEGYLMQMASQGQSFFQASGDGDAYAASCGAIPWPSDDLYVTSVGGTELVMTNRGSSYVSESVWNTGYDPNGFWFANCQSYYWGSGGGVSTSFSIPLWQQSVNVSAVGGSTTMRNIPDVALTADLVWVDYEDGLSGPFMGTSCAAPLWAGYTALVNQQAASLGLSSVGFLNPALYGIGQGPLYSSAFHDTTEGDNFWPSSPSEFSASSGFDLCTGWGTPNGMNLINALMPFGAAVWVDFNYTGSTQNGTYNYPFKTLAQGTNAVAPGGSIWIRTSGSSSETLTISKPLSIRAYSGPATIGN
jgi:subtilase family serine protease